MKIAIYIFLFVITMISYGQDDLSYDTTRHETNFDIEIWGAEPGWELHFEEDQLTGTIPNGKDSSFYMLVERISNMGFMNTTVDSYIFQTEEGKELTLILVKEEECRCGYDMREGEADTRAYVLINVGGKKRMLLGCATIKKRP